MLRMLLRRVGLFGFLLVGITLMTFLLSHVVPGDPVTAMVGDRADDARIEELRKQKGLDRPLWIQYGLYMKGLLRADLGESIRTGRPVLDDIAEFMPATIELSTAALVLSVMLGIPLGLAAALHADRVPDHVLRLVSLLGVSMPVFWLGLLALMVAYGRWDILPAGGRIGDFVDPPPTLSGLLVVDSLLSGRWEALVSALRHLCLPALVLGYQSTAVLARIVRSSMLEVLSQDYVRTARAAGLPSHQVIYRFALKNAMLPVVTVIGLTYGSLLSGAVLTETIFSWPGLGRYAVGSMVSLDFPAIMGVTLIIAVTYCVVNLAVDLAYVVLDPRVRDSL